MRTEKAKSSRNSIPGQENSMCQGPEVGRSRSSSSRKRKKTSVCGCNMMSLKGEVENEAGETKGPSYAGA